MELKLTVGVVGSAEVRRLVRELAQLDDYFVSAAARGTASADSAQPRIGQLLGDLARNNNLNLLEAAERKKLTATLSELLKNAPSMHLSFASEPSPKALEKIVAWFRDNINPNTLLSIGLQPSIAAGCVLRTPNQLFDMSIRAKLRKQGPMLLGLVSGAVK